MKNDSEFISSLLESWGLGNFLHLFIEQEFTRESFSNLQYECLADLFPKAGPQNQFWAEYKNQFLPNQDVSGCTIMSVTTFDDYDSLVSSITPRPKYLQISVVSATIEAILNGNEVETKRSLRINQKIFKFILAIMPQKHHGWSVDYELIVFLYWMASGCSYRVVGNFSGLSRYTIRAPIFKNAVGAIDGCHIRIKCPVKKHDEYINYKEFYSIVLQAVGDTKGMFRNYFIGYPGSVHDTGVLQNSPLYRLNTFPPTNFYLLGDGGYPCKLQPCALITPYKNPNENQKKFNTAHSKARNVVECAFGIMKSRWRNIFFKALEQNIKNCVKIITVACILHNICILGDDLNLNLLESHDDPDNFDIINRNRNDVVKELILETRYWKN